MQRPGAASLHLFVPEPHRHALPAGIALSGLLHAAALGLRPPAQIEQFAAQPVRATSFVVDVIDRDTPPVLTAPLAPVAEPPALPIPRAPRVAAPRLAVAAPQPSEPALHEPAAHQTAANASTPAEPVAPALPVPSAAADQAATSAAPANAAGGGSTTGSSAATAASTGSATAAGTPAVGSTASDARAGQARIAASRAQYLRALTTRIREHRQYPYLARRQGLEGTVCLHVALGARGQLIALRVTCGGESEALVEAAKTAVTEAAPFEPLPPDLGTSFAVEVPIVFRLEEG